ncbi:MAG: PA-phosphatase [Brevundimonas sp.]|uniref:PA-phosphatase n=1 Tax=Brevundimonas sp. TaxID=1871086 RepID=UPI00271D3D31|nr:PA-phosphatase [Brevundimonas sp.]MDO9586731.1 PA-phosphatase [Brevundimonas sp.]MDP3369048.1 PA-phosphatase [Brevundimonas sp.]MDP3655874.1 PA-phosphatase [Brevundimonas sp.]MDZ4109006.1 PA-phosphatase [Brevundimonas sp.]
MKQAAALAACLLMGGCATARVPAAAPVQGYLDEVAVREVSAAFTPSPIDPAHERAVFDSVEPGTDRWWLAIVQAELRPPEAAQHFDCIFGTRLAERPRPALTRLMNRLLIDSAGVTNALAEREPRRRPVAEQPGLESCVRMDEAARNSPSWPAGGAVVGATYGEMFAALAPDQAEAARRRGLDIGYSRALCRVNWHADVTDGVRIGQAVYERAVDTPAFAADLEAARVEVHAARAAGVTNPGCAAERRALRPTDPRPGGD